jgi:hypothetical protein
MFGSNALLRSTDALVDVLARAALVVAIARACVAIRQARRDMMSVVGRGDVAMRGAHQRRIDCRATRIHRRAQRARTHANDGENGRDVDGGGASRRRARRARVEG